VTQAFEGAAPVVRVAAIGDLHFIAGQEGQLAARLEGLRKAADLLLVAGDLTERGHPDEGAGVGRELAAAGVPVLAVPGNHDHHMDKEDEVVAAVESHGVRVLRGEGVLLDVGPLRLGVAGVTGFGGGFPGTTIEELGEGPPRDTADFAAYAREQAGRLESALKSLDADVRIALLHYSPCRETLRGERLELYPVLGSHLLAQAIDKAGADLVLHGHAHFGRPQGATPGGIPVRNVALPVVRNAIQIFRLSSSGRWGPGRRRSPSYAWSHSSHG
jgi:Icc-related predicted phosphoesterase